MKKQLEVRGGYTKTEKFLLKKTLIVEVADDTHLYRASRKEIRKAFEKGTVDIVYRTKRKGPKWFAPVSHLPNDRIHIGCQVFVGDDYRILRRWAEGAK